MAAWLYADTSVLVQRLVREPGSAAASRATEGAVIVTSALAPVETLSAITAKHRGGSLRLPAFRAALGRLEVERAKWVLVEVSPGVLLRAWDVVRDLPTRTLDAIHIASALFFRDTGGLEMAFLTADQRQRESATAAGLVAQLLASAP